jgi:hypothetical protein
MSLRRIQVALLTCGYYHQNKIAELSDIRFSIGNAAMYGGKVHGLAMNTEKL